MEIFLLFLLHTLLTSVCGLVGFIATIPVMFIIARVGYALDRKSGGTGSGYGAVPLITVFGIAPFIGLCSAVAYLLVTFL